MADQTVGKLSSKTKTPKLATSIAKRPKTTMDTEQVNVEPSKEPQSWLSSRSFREYHLWITRQLWHNLTCNNDCHDHCNNDGVEKVEESSFDLNKQTFEDHSKNKKSYYNVKHNRNSPPSDTLDKPIKNDIVTTIHDHDAVNCRVGSIDIISESMTSELKLWRCGSGIRQLSSGHNPRRGILHVAVAIFYLVMYITTPCLALREGGASNCTFPTKWEGTWFISGFQNSIHIKGSQFGYRGKCMASDGDKYLIADGGCHRCLVIYEKHKNVLQYKESECEGDSMYMDQSNPAAMPMRSILKSDHRAGAHPNLNGHSRLSSSDQYIMRSNDDINDCFCKERETLQSLCDQIPGDALLYSLFKENAEPIKCPLRGPFTFTYNRGHGECRSPVSNIESCTEESRLLLSFQACPDVQGTESTVETLTCLADWKDGNSRYLVGLVTHNHAISNEERFRCFVYEKMSTLMIRGSTSSAALKDAEYKLAQSGDATCNGLENAEVGSRIMTLRNRPPDPRCDFPAWLKGPRHWHALKGNAGYIFHQSDGSMHITKANGELETRALCGQINKNVPTEVMAVLNYTTGCKSGFMCMVFYRRDTHVAEIQMGLPASRLEDACAPDYFDILKLPFITLLASSSESQTCPIEGLYSLKGAIGPPYVLQRHKRNHNNKGHSLRSHHHHEAHKRLIYRNPDGFSHNRGISSIRSRRNVPLISSASSDTFGSGSDTSGSGTPTSGGDGGGGSGSATTSLISQNAPSTSLITSSRLMEYISKPTNDKIAFQQIGELNETQRNRRDTSGCLNYMGRRQLLIGCTEPHLIEVRPQCTDDNDEVYSCHGSWSENGTVYIVTWHARAQHRICITYRPTEGKSAKLVIGDTCYRPNQKLSDHHLVANVTSFGKCGDTNSAKPLNNNDSIIRTLATAMLIILFVTRR